MSAVPSKALPAQFQDLREVPVAKIDRNPANPRLIFPEEELQRLAESIDKEGVLVPIVVYKEGSRFILVDGERRWRCAQELGLESLPAVLTKKGTARENLIQMFNIHLVREPWQDMPTAWALEKLISETGETRDQGLADITGLSLERIRRLRHALELPTSYQSYIHNGEIPLNFFWELKRNVVDPLARLRPDLYKELGGKKVRAAFVRKRLSGVVTDTVSLRDVRPIINFSAKDLEDKNASVLDDTIRALVQDDDLSINLAYEDTVQIMVEADKLERGTKNMLKSFERLLDRVRTDEERRRITRVGTSFVKQLVRLLK